MVSAAQIKRFIAEIAPIAQKAYKTLGKVYPSICIGMACVECGYGTAGSCKHHSYLGQKVGTGKTATKYWSGNFFTSKTKEEYTVGVHTTIKSAFRSYDSMEQCVFNYYELLNTSLYSRVTAGVPFTTQMQQIKQCGYMTSSTEVNSVISIIMRYHLTDYDISDDSIPYLDINPYTMPTRAIRKGMRGNGVKWLQYELNKHGYVLAVDGIAGDITIGAVLDFQKKHPPLEIDGICGKLTKAALLK